jgi:hypothetical protein
MSSYGGSGGIGYNTDAGVEQLIESYAALADSGIGFTSTIDFWAQQFDTHGHPPKDTASLAFLARALLGMSGGSSP